MRKAEQERRRRDLTVQAKDCYDPADYMTVHKSYFVGMREAMRKSHGDGCICIYCSPSVTVNERQS